VSYYSVSIFVYLGAQADIMSVNQSISMGLASIPSLTSRAQVCAVNVPYCDSKLQYGTGVVLEEWADDGYRRLR
jgi:hypothetical protein